MANSSQDEKLMKTIKTVNDSKVIETTAILQGKF